MVVETIRTVAFECGQMLARGELTAESLPGVLDQVNKLALAAQRLSRSSAEEERRERQIRSEARQQTAEELARRVESEPGKSAGPERMRQIARELYGV